MTTLHVQLDDDVLSLLDSLDQPRDTAAREMILLELYRRGMLSSGKAADLLHMDRTAFIEHAGRLGISHFDLDADEWRSEYERGRKL